MVIIELAKDPYVDKVVEKNTKNKDLTVKRKRKIDKNQIFYFKFYLSFERIDDKLINIFIIRLFI